MPRIQLAGPLAAGDVDGDTDLDLVVGFGSLGSPVVNELWLNDGSGTFTLAPADGTSAWSNELADIDGDGDLDAYVSGEGHSVYVNSGTAVFTDEPGWLLVDLGRLVSTRTGRLAADGEARVRPPIPNDPSLIGDTSYWQAFVGNPGRSTNAAVTTLSGL